MKTYLIGMMQERWVSYEAETPDEAKELAQIDHPKWLVVGANEA